MIDDEKYLRVTEVLSPFSGLNKIDQNILKNAAQRGERVHLACEAIIKNLSYFPDPDYPEDENYIKSFQTWLIGKKNPQILPRLFCDQFMIKGLCDMVYEDHRGLVLVDWKTPIKESKTWLLQGSAYSYLAKKNGYPIQAIEFVKLSKIGKPPVTYLYEENFYLFQCHLEAYRYSFKDSKPEIDTDYL